MNLPTQSRAIRVVRLPSGETSLEINVLGLQQPSEFFHADWYGSEIGSGSSDAKFFFGKLSVGAPRLIRVLEVSFGRKALASIRETLDSKDFMRGLRSFIASNGTYVAPSEARAQLVDSQTKEFSFVATFAFMGFAENDAAISFFRMPPGAELIAGMDPTKVVIHPLVRIDTTAAVLHAFCSDIISVVDGKGSSK